MGEAEKTKYWDLLSQRFQRFFANFALDGIKAARQKKSFDPALITE